jgi:RimJ/RimL family protein N-acetyltransferase
VTEPTLRPATLDDAGLAADLTTASYPAFPQDPVVTRFRWEHPRKGWSMARFIAELHGSPVAYLEWIHGPRALDPERKCEVGAALDRAYFDAGLLEFLWDWVTNEAAATGSRVLEAYVGEDEPEALEVLSRAGYERDRVDKVWELDLRSEGARLTQEAHRAQAGVERDGYRITNLAGWRAPRRYQALHALDDVTRKDIPATFPILPEAFEDYIERVGAPDRPHDRWWIALRGDEPVAMSYLRYPPVRGRVWTGYTCSHPDHRGRGLARAVKLQTLAQAVELGVPSVGTDNDSENAPMLHINERLGYVPLPGFVGLLKRVHS